MRITISKSLFFLGASVATAFALTIGLMTFTLKTVKIEGPEYARIVAGKDLVADILPPPMFLVEAYLLASEIQIDDKRAAGNLPRIAQLKTDYAERLEVWRDSILPDDLKQIIEAEIAPASDSFWRDMTENFLPARQAGDDGAKTLAFNRLRDDFTKQKAVVETLVEAATKFLGESEAEAHRKAVFYSTLAYSAAAIAVLALFGGLSMFRRRAIVPLISISDYMTALAQGDLRTEVPFAGRGDEMGDMARSVAVFRQAGIDKLTLEEQQKERAEIDKAEQVARQQEKAAEAASLLRVVSDLGAGLERLSEFNIRSTLDEPFEPKFEALRHDFNKSLAAFQSTMSEVLDKSQEIQSSSQSLSISTDQLAKRTEQQAAALEQTAAALAEITTSVALSTARTADTRAKSRSARQNVDKSTAVVESAIGAMKKIVEASSQIGNITNVIDEIAFQTNLLALNAGVEAARAGEAGRGFAVVAQEVRELAQRSASAAKEIKVLIQRSGEEVASGVQLVTQTGAALREIEGDITGIASDIEAIAQSSSEQATGLTEVSSAVNQMDQLTQQNAAMVEETTAATYSLAEEVSVLVKLVSQFVFNRRSTVRDTPDDRARTLALRGENAIGQARAA